MATVSNDWQISTAELGQVVRGADDVAQCVRTILKTQLGSDPLRPTFGLDLLSYVDLPVNLGAPLLRNAIIEALALWEPRVTVTRVEAVPEATGKVTMNITWISPYGPGITEITY